MTVTETKLPGVLLLEPTWHKDDRGYFCETWNRKTLAEHGIDIDFVQDNHSISFAANTVRGLHFQGDPEPQAKLVRCVRGAVFDAAVDIRKGSPTYGQWTGALLSAENGRQLLIPAGFLHGFATHEPNCEVIYKCSHYYSKACEGAVRFDDPEIGIDWGLTGDVVIHPRDADAPLLRDFDSPFTYEAPA